MTEKNLESIFRKTLEHYEADVNPSLWQSVQSGMAGKGAAASGASGAGAGNATGLFTKGLLWIAGAAIVGGTAYFLLPEQEQPVAGAAKETPAQPVTLQPAADATPVETKEVITAAPSPVTPASSPKKQAVHSSRPLVPGEPAAATAADLPPATVSKTHIPDHAAMEAENSPSPVVQAPGVQRPSAQPAPREQARESGNETAAPQEYRFGRIEDHLLDIDKLPTAFSPNGDGLNDRFTIRTHDLKSLEVTIFDAGGNQVYQWNGLDGGWSGRLANGSRAPSGTYRYAVKGEATDGTICIGYSLLLLRENLRN